MPSQRTTQLGRRIEHVGDRAIQALRRVDELLADRAAIEGAVVTPTSTAEERSPHVQTPVVPSREPIAQRTDTQLVAPRANAVAWLPTVAMVAATFAVGLMVTRRR